MELIQTMKKIVRRFFTTGVLLAGPVFVVNAQKMSAADSARLMQIYNRLKKDTGAGAIKKDFNDPLFLKQKNTPPDWALPEKTDYNADEADLVVRIGDIDNFGFGWDIGYNPFSGKTTQSSHKYPYKPGTNDIAPTDQILVPTGYKGVYNPKTCDGYTRSTQRPANIPKPFVLRYDLKKIQLHTVKLQLFVDDFQAPLIGTYFRVTINGKRVPYLESMLNSLNQTGPVGKLVTFTIDPSLFPEVEKGNLSIFIDDPVHNLGDGYAVDFIRLLINPKNIPSGKLSGMVADKKTGQPLPGATISIGDQIKATADSKGKYTLNDVPAGLAVVSAFKDTYRDTTVNTDVPEGKAISNFNIYLNAKTDNLSNMEQDLAKKGNTQLYNILFDSGKASIKSESLPALQQLLTLIRKKPDKQFTISGHTDNTGDEAANLQLSQQRALAVVNWLKDNGIAAKQLISKGYGSAMPVATNNTETGKARNRRVQLDMN